MNGSAFRDPYAEARQLLRAFWDREPAALADLRATMWDESGQLRAEPPLIPPGFQGITCGAKTRKGTPCESTKLWPPSYRCALHGGLSGRPQDVRARTRLVGAVADDATDRPADETEPGKRASAMAVGSRTTNRALPKLQLQRRRPTDWPAVLKEITDSGLSLGDVAQVLEMPKQTIHGYVKARPGRQFPAIPNHPDGCAILDLLALVRARADANTAEATDPLRERPRHPSTPRAARRTTHAVHHFAP